ncbi:MAG: hypothetical protein IJV94_00150 [Bacilli bacterium]|nr:hypothetical protein [Bacilli bacterium]
MVILTFIVPFYLLLTTKIGEKIRLLTIDYINEKHNKLFFILRILFTLYLIISGIFICFYTIHFESMYFYNEYNIYIIAIILSIPLVIFSKKIIKSTFHLHPLTLIIYLIFFYLLFRTNQELKYYTLSFEKFEQSNLIQTIILLIPLFMEPILFFYLFDLSKEKIVKRKMILSILLISTTSAYCFLQIGNQFGVLLDYIDFPFYQLWKNIYLNEYIENFDCINIIIIIFNCVARLLLSVSIICKINNTNSPLIVIIYAAITLTIACILINNQMLFEEIKLPLLSINSVLLLILFCITIYFMFKIGGIKINE